MSAGRRRRITVVGLMALVAVAAVGTWLVRTASEVHRTRDQHLWHLWMDRRTGALSLHGHSVPFAFGRRLVRALLGRPWYEGEPCACLNPNLRELARAGENPALLRRMNDWSSPYQQAVSHRQTVDALEESIAWDEKRAADTLAQAETVPPDQRGSFEGVHRAFLDTIAHNRRLLAYHRMLLRKYEAAALAPWNPVPPDPAPPKHEAATGR